MSDDIKLDSAAAVEVAAFCWPGEWVHDTPPLGETLEYWPAAVRRDEQGRAHIFPERFNLRNFNDLHRAAAVLVERGLAERLNRKLIGEWGRTRDVGPHTNDFMAWLLSAPADAWARAIVATVREVKR